MVLINVVDFTINNIFQDHISKGSFSQARTDPNSDYKAQMTTDFSGGGYTQTTRTDKGSKVTRFPNVNAKITTTTTKPKGSTKLNTTNTFRGNL